MFDDKNSLYGLASIVGGLCAMFNRDERIVEDYKCDLFEIDTCIVYDRDLPYETAIKHKHFNNGNWLIIGWAATEEEAKEMHAEFVKDFTETEPDTILDVYEGCIYPKQK